MTTRGGWGLDSLESLQGDWHPLSLEPPALCARKSSELGRVANSKGWGGLQTPKVSFPSPDHRSTDASSMTDTIRLHPERRVQGRFGVTNCVSKKLTIPQHSPSDTLTHRCTDTPTPHPR